MYNHVQFGSLPASAKETADFVLKINNLFDCLNSSSRVHEYKFKSALTIDSSLLQYLDEIQEWLSSWEIRSLKTGKVVSGKFRFRDGFMNNITAVKMLLGELVSNKQFQFLLTRRLCSDPLENFFSVIRGRRGFDQNPTCLGFAQAFKQAVCN